MRAAIIAFSDKGSEVGGRVLAYFAQSGDAAALTRCEKGELLQWTKQHFGCDALIFIGSCGIAVRAIAPLLKSKTCDPAVIVIDELASHVISLLSGHIGGANDLTVRLANFLGAQPVITTATDLHKVFAVDAWAARQGLKVANPKAIGQVSSRLLAGETVKMQSDFPLAGQIPKGIVLCDKSGDVQITHRSADSQKALLLIVPVVTLGIGCKKGISAAMIEQVFAQTLRQAHCHALAVARVCSIDLKALEPGILAFCKSRALPYKTFSARQLAKVDGEFFASEFVKQKTGVDNVCERSAVLGSGWGGRLITRKISENGVTMALAISPRVLVFDGGET
jgi:cobalt-precorrin 5A hydrolase